MPKTLTAVLLSFAVLAAISLAFGQARKPKARPPKPAVQVKVNLDEQLAKFKQVTMPFNEQALSPREIRMVRQLVTASHYIEDIFWRQSDPDGLALYKSLVGSADPTDQKLLRLLMINGSRFDLIAGNRPFVGDEPMSPDHGLYAKGLTAAEIERYVTAHPETRAAIYSPYTVVRRAKNGGLEGVPYHVVYRQWLLPAARALREAAALSDDPAFARFLLMRADALLSDDYYPSDIAWLELKSPKFDVIFAPYETYLDDVLGVKTSYGAAVMIRNDVESEKLAIYQKYVPDIQEALPLSAADLPSKRGHQTPMEVMDAPFRAGDLRHGYQAVADNLPNDPRIHQEKGSKKIFFKNFMDARVNYVILPLAKRLMAPEQAARVNAEGYVAGTIMHEMAHGLGPAFARINDKQVDIREAIGPIYSGLEEAKADIVGLFGLKWLAERGVVSQQKLEEGYASHVADLMRTVRFSSAEAHGAAELMEFNYLLQQGAVRRDAWGRYEIDSAKMSLAVNGLTRELLEIEATGNKSRAEKWFANYGTMPDSLKAALAQAKDVPVDIEPVFSFPEPIK